MTPLGSAPDMPRLLLPAWSYWRDVGVSGVCARWLGRAERGDTGTDARTDEFRVVPAGWPLAALSRQHRFGDAGTAVWLRADPACLRADLADVRLIAHGPALDLRPDEATALAATLRPLFGDAGLMFDWPHADGLLTQAWLRLPHGAPLPSFSAPEAALGDDLLAHLPHGRDAPRWRALFNEVQVVLHQHPANALRLRRGQAPINALWLWGGGSLPHDVQARSRCLYTDDPEWAALQHASGAGCEMVPDRWPQTVAAGMTFDLRARRDADGVLAAWLQPACEAIEAGRMSALQLHFEDGTTLALRRGQRWRFWRRPWSRFGGKD